MKVVLYENAPFRADYSDVMAYASPVGKQRYFNSIQHIEIDKPLKFNKELNYIDIAHSEELRNTQFFNFNYCRIYDDTDDIFEKYYFITDYEKITSSIYRLKIKIDVWNTYAQFMYLDNEGDRYLNNFEFKKTLFTGAHNLNENGDVIGLPVTAGTPTTATQLYINYRLVNAYDEGLFVAVLSIFNGAYVFLNNCNYGEIDKMQQLYSTGKLKIIDEEEETSEAIFTPLRFYFVPFNHNAINAASAQVSALTFELSMLDIIDGEIEPITKQIYINEQLALTKNIQFSEVLEPTYKWQVGTFLNRLDVQADGLQHNFIVNFRISKYGEIDFYIQVDNAAILNIIDGYAVPVVTDLYADYVKQNETAMRTNNAMIAANLGINLAAAAVGGTFGATAAIGATANAISNYVNNYAKYSDLKTQPFRIDGKFDALAFCLQYGVSLYMYDYNNNNDIIDGVNMYGYALTKYARPNVFNDDYFNDYNFLFYKTAGAKIALNGLRTYEAAALEDIFNNGVRIWYNKDEYLNTTIYTQ